MLQRVRDLKVQYNNGTLERRRQGRDRGRGRADRSRRSATSRATRSSTASSCLRHDGTLHVPGRRQRRRDDRTPPRTSAARASAASRPDEHHRRGRRVAGRSTAAAPGEHRHARRRDQERLEDPRRLRRGAEPPGAPPEQPGDLPGEPDRVRVPHPRRGHGGGDDQVHQAQHPAAGRHEHARAGQPGPAGRPLAPALSNVTLSGAPVTAAPPFRHSLLSQVRVARQPIQGRGNRPHSDRGPRSRGERRGHRAAPPRSSPSDRHRARGHGPRRRRPLACASSRR